MAQAAKFEGTVVSVVPATATAPGTMTIGSATIHDALERTFAQHGLEAPPKNESKRVIGLSLVEAVPAPGVTHLRYRIEK